MGAPWSICGAGSAQSGTPARQWRRDTVSIVYSCTKAATALCLHMLVDQGKVSYETPGRRYLA